MIKQFSLFMLIFILSIYATVATAQEDSTDDTVGVGADVIEAYPEPNVTQIYASDSLLHDRVYRRVNGAVERYGAPNGAVSSVLGSGFNFVTVTQFIDGWAEISPGTWVKTEHLSEDVAISSFAGVLLPEEGLPYTMAWTLTHLYPASAPGGEPNEANPYLLRYTKVSIYDSVDIEGWRWYQIGVDQWVHQTKVAKVLPVERPVDVDTEKWVSVDLYEQVAIAYEGETPVFATLIASGLPEWSTNEGLFNIYVRYPRTIMSGSEGLPDFYYLEEVPWTMYFDNDIALHGAYWHDGFGYRRSHGCVNMSITDAHWMYEFTSSEFNFEEPGDTGAAVFVYSSDTYR